MYVVCGCAHALPKLHLILTYVKNYYGKMNVVESDMNVVESCWLLRICALFAPKSE